jgi:hypothetical protein
MNNEKENNKVCDSDFMSDEKKFWTSIISGLTQDESKYKTVLGRLRTLKTRYVGFQRFGYIDFNKTATSLSQRKRPKVLLPSLPTETTRNVQSNLTMSKTIFRERPSREIAKNNSPFRFYTDHLKLLKERKPKLEGFFKAASLSQRSTRYCFHKKAQSRPSCL